MKRKLPIFKKFWFWGIVIGVMLLISVGIYLSNSIHSTATKKFNNDKIMSSSKKIKKSTSSSSTSKIKHSTTEKNEIVASKSSADNPISTSETSSASSTPTTPSISSNYATDYIPEKPTAPSSTTSPPSSLPTHQTNDDENSSHSVQHMVSEGYVLVNSTTGQYYSEIKAGLELPSIYIYMTKKEADSKGYHKASANTDYEIYIPELSEAPTYEERTSQTSSSAQ
ncbi:hypothetical protein [Lactococcus lactis]|uniref:hypothetical protein n=1 Tax=Lactococcus lactis TaxID=1358 RepID=UPI003D0E54EF